MNKPDKYNNIFDKLYDKYGLNDDIIEFKNKLLILYNDENSYRITKRNPNKEIYVDENGYVKLIDKK